MRNESLTAFSRIPNEPVWAVAVQMDYLLAEAQTRSKVPSAAEFGKS